MLTIDYYSDILCIWAWIAQRRIEELNEQFSGKIIIRHHYMDIFGDVNNKMTTQWAAKGGYDGFAKHVNAAIENYAHAPVNPDVWRTCKPSTSANAHLFIKAVALTYSAEAANTYAKIVREAFFVHAMDISQQDQLIKILTQQGLEKTPILKTIAQGDAIAALMNDYQTAKQLNLKGSPSYVMNDERQILYGNVGYRVLSANVEELLKQVHHEASWC